MNRTQHYSLLKAMEIDKFFELEKAGITKNDDSEAAQWLRAIKVIVKEEPVPEKIMQNETFRRLLDSVKLINFVEELFNCEAKNMTDLKAEHEIGFSEGAAEERAKAEKEKREMAKILKEKNVAVSIIAESTGISEEEIQAL